MPAINETISIEDGVSVFNYAKGKEGWYVRKWNKQERRYRVKRIKGAETKEDALANFYKVMVAFEDKPQKEHTKQSNPHSIRQGLLTDEVKNFLNDEEKRVRAGFKAENSHIRRTSSLKTLLMYLEVKDVEYPHQITETTLDDYVLFRADLEANTIKTELKDIGVFMRHHLMKHKLISNEVGTSPFLIPKVVITDDMLDSNPAITDNDYQTINNYIRNVWIGEATYIRGSYSRRAFYTFIHLLKNSGCRPIELRHLKIKDITITNPYRWSESKQKYEDDFKLTLFIRKSKTGKPRNVICRSNAGKHLLDFMKYQSTYLNDIGISMNDNSLLFGNPTQKMEKCLAYRRYTEMWTEITNGCAKDLEFNKFSDKNYTIYSLRSTFIENCITDGLDVYLVAKLCGNSVTIIQRYYDRHDVLNRSGEVQHIEMGKTKPPKVETINVVGMY